ncbi:DUF4254 domain-containing protein [Nocardia asteroides]|uniref:DUF4254 domain-containing protein n=1 Tax=Nocardia asteroides TaxID=1824 RepID=UPI001E4B8A87|nr:DUF4254 domain-containing protein [Nocardia asteroides]UGT59864.1 hypothetical protein LTT61_21905 [Nocardia asteroides]
MRPVMPDKLDLLAACRGVRLAFDDPVLDAAADLALLHQQREQIPHCALRMIDAERSLLMSTIDTWVHLVIPEPSVGARVHTQTIGQVIDRLAQLTAYIYTALAGSSDEVFIESMDFVEELATAYTDLVAELFAGTRRLPTTTTSV